MGVQPALSTVPEDPVDSPKPITFVAIHGVGNPAANAIRDSVAATISHQQISPSEVLEFNWNTLVEHPLKERVLSYESFCNLAESLSAACSVCIEPPAKPDLRNSRALERASAALFSTLDFCYSLCVGVLFLSIIVGAGASALTHSETTESVEIWSVTAVAWSAMQFFALSLGSSVIALAALRSALKHDSGYFWIAVRRLALTTMRPLLMIIYTIFLVPWSRLLGVLREKALPTSISALILCLAFLALDRFLDGERPLSEAALEVFGAIGMQGAIFAFFGLILGSLSLATATLVAPLMKVSLDVARYIGDERYRDRIQYALELQIRNVEPDRRLVLVCHSLGTVIAIHSLCTRNVWRPRDITLITLGSPLRRFFARFFPGLFFPRSMSSVATLVNARCSRFKWVNCFRPFDQVGTSLGLSASDFTRETSTRQWAKFLDAHPDYWTDSIVGERVRATLSEMADLPISRSELSEAYRHVPESDKGRHKVTLVRCWSLLCKILLIAFPAFTLAYQVHGVQLASALGAEALELLNESGVESGANATHWREMIPMPQGHGYTNRVHISHVVEGRTYEITLEHTSHMPFQLSSYLVDMKALIDYIRQDCVDVQGTKRPYSQLARRCMRSAVPIKYDSNNPDKFIVISAPPNRSMFDNLKDSAFRILLTLSISGLLAMIMFFFSSTWLAPFLGIFAQRTQP